jgi:murein DD-endopeptidase MepM/ murein hydrolase activator NlpD
MSVRQNWPKARPPQSRFELALSHRGRRRSLVLRPGLFYALVALAPIVGLVYLALSLYLVFHDDMLAALMSRASAQQYAYEDQASALRSEISRMTRARLVDQTAYEEKIRDLMSRQAQIEQRAATIAALANRAGLGTADQTIVPEASLAQQAKPRPAAQKAAGNALDPLLAIPGGRPPGPASLPAAASAFGPVTPPPLSTSAPTPVASPASETKPQPLAIELRSDNSDWISPQPQMPAPAVTANAAPVEFRLGAVADSLDKIENTQMRDIATLGSVAHKTNAKLRGALAETGLEADHLKPPPDAKAEDGIGGPFIPVQPDAGKSPFDQAALELQDDLLGADQLKRLLPYLPLRQPVAGPLQVTSPFGTRIDPFFGRLALHPGVDLRQAYGSAVYATAAGKVTIAAPSGGYGNLVEIDHGNRLATRYGHLSTILVTEGETVEAGQEVGKIGSTGRSTGPHLHYEVRIDGEPVDPMRFLKAGMKLATDE